MIEKVLHRGNMLKAYRHVLANKGSAGVDGMRVEELALHLKENRNAIATAICNGRYQPQPILGVEIPKSNGENRLLGIPTVTDRVLQQAASQVLTPLFELEFREHSYGFRPNRNAHQAVQQAHRNIHEGYQHIVDIDLKSFFDEVDHCLLLQLLYRKVKCPLTLRLVRKWLRAPILIKGRLAKRRKGVPQGSPLSPLLSRYQLVVAKKGWARLKQKLKRITRKTTPCSFEERVRELKEAQRGWVHYFRMASIQGKLKDVDSWIRNRLRHCIWHDWKRMERKRKNLIRLGVPKWQAYAWSRTRKGGWAVAQSPILITTVTVKRLARRGYESLLDYYRKMAPQLNEPLYARPACTVV
jgi:retron-type reverse transcriptase